MFKKFGTVLNYIDEHKATIHQGYFIVLTMGMLFGVIIFANPGTQRAIHDRTLRLDMMGVVSLVETWIEEHPEELSDDALTQFEPGQEWLAVRGPNIDTSSALGASDTPLPDGMLTPEVTEETTLGVTFPSSKDQSFCVYGINYLSNYYGIPSRFGEQRQRVYFYDSLKGEFLKSSELSEDSACARFIAISPTEL